MYNLPLRRCIFFVLVLLLVQERLPGQEHPPAVTLANELRNYYDISALPVYRSNSIVGQVSTYDTTGGNNDGFNGNYSFIRRNADSSLVIFDQSGPGMINRIWTPTVSDDTLDFYIDDTTRPLLSIRYRDLFSGKRYPFIKPLCGSNLGGNYCCLPILFSSRCIIVFRGKNTQFHQIQYRQFKKGTPIQSFTGKLTDADSSALDKIVRFWAKSKKEATDFTNDQHVQATQSTILLNPGETKTIAAFNKGGRITGIRLSPASTFEGNEKNIDLHIYWDGEKEPAIYCPVADFFGYAFGKISMQALLLGTSDNSNYCWLPMPFTNSAKIELVSRKPAGSPAVQLSATVYYSPEKQVAANEGKLYSVWHSGKTVAGKPHTLLSLNGKGHYIGTLLQAQGLQPGMTYFFEGDDSTVIDGHLRLHGTGSEDYFNGGWYAFMDRWDAKQSLPLHGSLDYSLPFCRTGGYRFYISDKLPFEESIDHSIEHGPEHNNIPSLYTSIAFYYGNRAPLKQALPDAASAKVYVPDTLIFFPQLLKYSVWEGIEAKSLWAYPTGGMSFKFTATEASMLRLSLDNIPAGKYKLYADYTKFGEGCSFSIWQRQEQIGAWVDSYTSGENQREAQHYIGEINVPEIDPGITFHFKTNEERKKLFLNRIILIKQ